MLNYTGLSDYKVSLLPINCYRGEHIPSTKSHGGEVNSVRWTLTFVRPQYETCFMSPVYNLCGVSQMFGKSVYPYPTVKHY